MRVVIVFFSLFFFFFQSSYSILQHFAKIANTIKSSLPKKHIPLTDQEEAQKIIEEAFAQLRHMETKNALIKQEWLTTIYPEWKPLIANNIERDLKTHLEKINTNKQRLLEIIKNLSQQSEDESIEEPLFN